MPEIFFAPHTIIRNHKTILEMVSTYDLIESAEPIDINKAVRYVNVEQNFPHNQKKAKAEAKK